ncbi:MAG: hypothetical protein K2G85_07325 [Muribaculaceae bacterium]|nr:hypothetical protein [Muribaculaceae bacterium]
MAKKTATYAKYELRVEDNGKIVILNDGQPVQNAMGAIRTIAADVSFNLDPKWNTQSSGRKLIDFLNTTTATPPASAKAEESASLAPESTVAPKQTSKPSARQVVKSDKHNTENELTEEEMNELLKQIAELRKTIEALESRIAKLEKGSATNSGKNSTREIITHHKYVAGDSYTDYYKTSEGRVLDAGYHYDNIIGSTGYLIFLRQILIEIGEEDAIDFKDLTDQTLKEAMDKNTDRYEQFITQITRLATKYGSKGTIPALLPNDAVLSTSGQVRRTNVTKRAIKF